MHILCDFFFGIFNTHMGWKIDFDAFTLTSDWFYNNNVIHLLTDSSTNACTVKLIIFGYCSHVSCVRHFDHTILSKMIQIASLQTLFNSFITAKLYSHPYTISLLISVVLPPWWPSGKVCALRMTDLGLKPACPLGLLPVVVVPLTGGPHSSVSSV